MPGEGTRTASPRAVPLNFDRWIPSTCGRPGSRQGPTTGDEGRHRLGHHPGLPFLRRHDLYRARGERLLRARAGEVGPRLFAQETALLLVPAEQRTAGPSPAAPVPRGPGAPGPAAAGAAGCTAAALRGCLLPDLHGGVPEGGRRGDPHPGGRRRRASCRGRRARVRRGKGVGIHTLRKQKIAGYCWKPQEIWGGGRGGQCKGRPGQGEHTREGPMRL